MRVGPLGAVLLLVGAAVATACAAAPVGSGAAPPRTVPPAAQTAAVASTAAASAAATSASAAPDDPARPTATPEPVVLQATGTATAVVAGGSAMFAARDGGPATCHSLPDSRQVGDVTALDLGELGPGTLRAMLNPAGPSLAAFIDGGDLPDGAYQPFWSGPVTIRSTGAGSTAGTATFAALTLEIEAATKPGEPPPGIDAWPDRLAGTISWTCAPWAAPDGPGRSAAPSASTGP